MTGNDAAPTSITWSYDGTTISDDSNFDITDSASSSTLVVKDVSKTTPSDYTCKMAWGTTVFTNEAEIDTFEFDTEDFFGIEGDDVKLTCVFYTETATISSAKIQKLVSSAWTNQGGSVFAIDGFTTTANLTTSSEGNYRCSVTDSGGKTLTSEFTFTAVGEFRKCNF